MIFFKPLEGQLDHCRPLRTPSTDNASNTTNMNTVNKQHICIYIYIQRERDI